MNQLEERIQTVISDHFGLPADTVRPVATFEELDMDSLILAELALILRKELGVTVEDWELDSEMTIADMAKMLEQRGAAE